MMMKMMQGMIDIDDIKFRFRIRRKGNGVETVDFFYFTLDMILDGWLKPFEKYEEWEILSVDRFAGLMDMEDQEIFENDFTKPYDTDGLFYASHIIFKHGCFGYIVDKYGEFVPLGRNSNYFDLQNDSHKSHVLKVIGNAHENPSIKESIYDRIK